MDGINQTKFEEYSLRLDQLLNYHFLNHNKSTADEAILNLRQSQKLKWHTPKFIVKFLENTIIKNTSKPVYTGSSAEPFSYIKPIEIFKPKIIPWNTLKQNIY